MTAPSPTAELPPLTPGPAGTVRAWAVAVLIAAALFAVIAPTLQWNEFTNGNEAIVTQTALEMRQGGPKLLPRLMGDPRVKKPPLVTWLTAAAIRPSTVAALADDSADHAPTREAAYRDLLWQVRWPTLLAACVLTLAVFEWGRVWAGPAVGLCAAMAVGTNYLAIKYLRQTTTDAHLTAWVAVANAALAHGLLRGRWWLACTVGAVATGVAFLCKGPVALVETLVPAAVFAALLRSGPRPAETLSRRPPWTAATVGMLLWLAVALPWFVYVLWNVSGVGRTWFTEVSREGATNLEVSNPAVYLYLGPMTAPWLLFGLAGLAGLWQRRGERAAWMPVVFALVPLLVMVWFRDRKERYMLPMVAPACLVCGYGAAAWAKSWQTRRTAADRTLLTVHVVGLLGTVAALLILGVSHVKGVQRTDGGAWFTPGLAAWAAVAALAWTGLIGLIARRRPIAVPAGTFVLILGVATLYFYGYSLSPSGKSVLKPLADAIRTDVPGAVVYDWLPRGRADEQIPLYLGHTVLRADPATLPASDRPTVVIARQAKEDPLPDLGPRWRLLKSVKEGNATWFAFVRTDATTTMPAVR